MDFDVISLYLCVFWGMPLTLQHPDFGSIKFWQRPCLPRSTVRYKSNDKGPPLFCERELYRSQSSHDYKGVLKLTLYFTFDDYMVPEFIH